MESMKKKAKQAPALPSPTADPDSSGGDRISALDDDLRELILRLAHLNVRELVRTSVLSKRWRSLWKRSPVLDFFGWPELKSAGDISQYIAIVNDVLEQRAGGTSEARIDEVKIPLLFEDSSSCGQRQQLRTPTMEAAMEAVEAWIRYAMHHQVMGLQLNLRLPPLLYKEHRNLKKLDLDKLLRSSPKLEFMHLGLSHTNVRLPRTAVFTLLKVLTLESMELVAGSGQLLARLFSSACCPSLQKLRMIRVDFGWNQMVLDAGELLELSMEGVNEMELLELRTPKLLYLEINKCKHLESLSLSSPGLKELTYFHNYIHSYTTFMDGPLPCVWRLKIDLSSHIEEDVDEVPNSNNISLLKHCSSSVRCLHVYLDVPSAIHRHIDAIKDKIPQLPMVTSLLVSIDVLYERHSFGDGVASLLTKFKNLKYLSLQLKDSPSIYLKRDEYYSEDDVDSAFTCNHPDHWESSNITLASLREADFRGMAGTGCELRFLQFVLASATDLQSVTMSFNLPFLEEEEKEEEEDEEEEEDKMMHYFVHTLLGHGTWTSCENKDQNSDKPNNCSKLYKWTPSP